MKLQIEFKTIFHLLHDYSTHHTSDSKQTAVAPDQDAVRVCRWLGIVVGRDRHIFAGIANHALRFTGGRLLRQSVAACTSMDVAASSARPDAAQLARTSQPDTSDQIRGDYFYGVDAGRIDLDFFGSAVDTSDLAGLGCNRCGDGVADTDTYSKFKDAV